MITYTDNLSGITPERLEGFFVGWATRPSGEAHLRMLQGSYRTIIAIDDESQQVVGFISAISDGVLSAYIPLLEVLPAFQGRGVGSELVVRMLDGLSRLYMVDICCDPELAGFYHRFGMKQVAGMILRRPQSIPTGA